MKRISGQNIMKYEQKKIGIILSYLTIFINIAIQLLYTPLMLRLLGQSEYGLYTLANGIISYLSLLDLGFAGAYLKFYSVYKVEEKKDEIAILNGTFLKLFLFLGSIATVAGIVLANNVGAFFDKSLTETELHTAQKLMLILSFSLGITLVSNVFNAIINANECFFAQKGIQLLKVIMSPFLAVPMMFMGYGAVSIALSTFLVSIVALAVNIYYCCIKLETCFAMKKTDFSLIKSMGSFSFFIFLNEIISQINWNVDKVLLGYFSGSIATAVYGVGAQIDAVYRSLSTAVSSVFAPRVNRIVAQKNGDTALNELFIKVGRVQFIVLAPVLIAFITFGEYFISIWAGAEYGEAYWVALLLIVPVTVPLIQNIGIDIQQAKNMHHFRSIIYFFMALLNVFISIPLCHMWGPIGAAFGTSVMLLIGNGIVMNIFYHNHVGIDVIAFWREIIKICKALILPIIFCIVIRVFAHMSMACFVGGGAIFIICYLSSIWKIGLNKKEKELFQGAIKKLLR